MAEANKEHITLFAQTNFRNKKVKFGIKTDDRRRHIYIIGKTGMGKSVLLENMIISDIRNGYGACMIDPHGDMVENIIKCVPRNRVDDIIYFNPADVDYPFAFNVFEKVDVKYRPLVASGVVGVFKKIWADSWGPRLEYILNNCILALLEAPNSTLLGVMRILTDRKYREQVVREVTDPMVKYFWTKEFSKYPDKEIATIISPIQNKVGQYLSNAMIRNIVGQPVSTINLRQVMDERKVLLLNLSKGRIGEDASSLLGALMITKIQLAAMSRVDIPEKEREDFYLYVDELQNFATDSFAGILSEARKYHLNLTMAHQYIEQLPESLRASVFGNVGTIISFRVGATDAEYLAKEFAPIFNEEDFVNLPKYHIYLKLMIDGVASQGFSASTLPPIAKPEGFESMIIDNSRLKYSRPVAEVENEILNWWNLNDNNRAELEERVAQEEKRDNQNEDETLVDFSETVKDQVTKMIKQSQADRAAHAAHDVNPLKTNVHQEKVPDSVPVETPEPAELAVKKVPGFEKLEKQAIGLSDDDKFNYENIDWYNIEKKTKEVSFDGKYVCDVCGVDMFLDFVPRLDKPILCQKCVKKRDKFMKRVKREKEAARALDAAEKAAERRLEKIVSKSAPLPARAPDSHNVSDNQKVKAKGSNWGMMKSSASHQQAKSESAAYRKEPPKRVQVIKDIVPTQVEGDFEDDLKKLYGDGQGNSRSTPRRDQKPDLPPATIRVIGRPFTNGAKPRDVAAPAEKSSTNGAKPRDGVAPADLAMTNAPATKVADASAPTSNAPVPKPPVIKAAVPKASFNPFGDDTPIVKSGLKDLAPGEEVNLKKDDK